MKKTSTILFIILIILIIGISLIYLLPSNEEFKDTGIIKGEDIKCSDGYECDSILDEDFKWSIKEEINIAETYDYENDILLEGKLLIENGVVKFINSNNQEMKSFTEINSEVISLEETYNDCCGVHRYYALTSEGEIFLAEVSESILVDDIFTKLDIDFSFKSFSILNENDEQNCPKDILIGKSKDEVLKKYYIDE